MIDFDAVFDEDVATAYPEIVEDIRVPAKTEINPLDIKSAKARIAEYDAMIDNMVAQAKSHNVIDDESNAKAVAMAGQTKAIANKIEKVRKSLVEKPNEYIKAINAFAKTYTTRLASIEYDLKAKINSYQVKQQQARIEAQRRAEEEARKLQEKLQAEARESGISVPIEVPAPIVSPAETITRTENGTASIRKVWKWVLKDFSQVPDQFKKLNEPEINLNIKAGVRHIPGLEIFEETQTVIRSASIGDNEKF